MGDKDGSINTHGVCAAGIRAFLTDLQDAFPDSYQDLTTQEACTSLVVPRTKESECAYLEVMRAADAALVAPATVFVSHAWRYKIADVLTTLLEFAKEEKDRTGEEPFFWFDLFVNNQHTNVTANLPQEWWSTTFKDSIAAIGKVLLVLTPWNNPVPLTRAWCLWEVFCSISQDNVGLAIRLPAQQHSAFMQAIVDNFEVVTDMLVEVRAEKADAWDPADKDMIFHAIQSSVGFAALNKAVKDQMRAWCLNNAIGFVTSMEKDYEQQQQQQQQHTPRKATAPAAKPNVSVQKETESVVQCEDGPPQAPAQNVADAPATDDDIDDEDMLAHNFSRLCMQVGAILLMFGDHDRAIEMLEKALAIFKRLWGGEHAQIATAYTTLGAAYSAKSDYSRAMEALQAGLGMQLRINGEEHESTASTYNTLGSTCISMGDYDRGIEYQEKALKVRTTVLGPDNVKTATAHNNLARGLFEKGDYKRTIEHFEEAVRISCAASKDGDKHPNTGATYNNLGRTYDALGDYDKALASYQRAVEVFCDTLGEDHSTTGLAYGNIGTVHDSKGDYDRAVEYFEKAIAIVVAALGDEHPSVANLYNSMASAFMGQGRYDQALQMYEKDLQITQASLGEWHMGTAASYGGLGSAYRALGEYDRAIEMYEKDLAIGVRVMGEKHPDVATTYSNLGAAYSNKGEHDRAIEHFIKCLEITIAAFGNEHPDVATCLNNLGSAYTSIGAADDAVEFLHRAVEIRSAVLGNMHPETAVAVSNLGRALRATGDDDQALECFELALEINRRVLGDDHPSTARALNSIGHVSKGKGDFATAVEAYKCAARIMEASFGADHPHTCVVKANLQEAQAALDEATSASQSQTPAVRPGRLSGWLRKRGLWNTAFQTRWFVLTDDALIYYRTQHDRVHKGKINLNLITKSELKQKQHQRPRSSSSSTDADVVVNELHITVPGRTFVIRVDERSDQTLAEWAEAIHQAQAQRRIGK